MSFPISPVPVDSRLGTAPSSPAVGRRAQRAAPRVSERSSLSWPDSPAAFAPRPVQPATRREAGWHGPLSPEAQARLYLEILEESDYAERLAPVVGGDHRDVLDIGAGNGALSRRCLARPARWLAVEPNVAMGEALARLRPQLARDGVDLAHLATTWQGLPESFCAESVFAFNLGATHHEADALFDDLAERCRREMVWVVPAQYGPSTFCLAGFLPPELHGADTGPAFERTLAALAREQQPQAIDFVDWQCRLTFKSRELVVRHFLERLELASDSAHGRAVADYLDYRLGPGGEEARIVCAKRSAVLRWRF